MSLCTFIFNSRSNNFDCVVVVDQYDKSYLIQLNEACRQKNIGYVIGGCLGLYGYTFVDYVYKIQNVALSTFHRDVTSSKNIYKTAHPVYTLILYKSGGDLLSVCPGSNKSYPFVWSNIVNISGEPGTAFLFDCDLLHAGCTNQCQKRDVIQYKICHVDDLDKLPHLQGVRANKTDVCEITTKGKIMRKLSYLFEFPINYVFYPLMIKRENSDSIIGKIL